MQVARQGSDLNSLRDARAGTVSKEIHIKLVQDLATAKAQSNELQKLCQQLMARSQQSPQQTSPNQDQSSSPALDSLAQENAQ